MPNTPEVLLFLHIPKAAGTTLSAVLGREFHPALIWNIDSARQEESRNAFAALPERERAKIRVIGGHMSFGIHEHVPGPSSYVTLLRDPVDRIISQYHFVLQRPEHYLHNRIVKQKMKLVDYALSGVSPELDNGQTRQISATFTSVPIGEMRTEHLQMAISNLRNFFSVVGVVSFFDEFILMVKDRFAIEDVSYLKRRVNKQQPAPASISEEDRTRIRSANELDMELYQFAKELQTQRLRDLGNEFQARIRSFRRYRQCKALVRGARKKIGRKLLGV